MTRTLASTITFSEEQAMLLDTATEFFREKSPIAEVRRQFGTAHGYDPALWREVAALGWTGVAIPEAHGGSGFGLAAAVTLAEPFGRYLSALPLVSTQLFVQGVVASDALAASYLPAVAEGAIGTVAVFEPDGDWRLEAATAPFDVRGAAVRLAGVKTLVADAAVADYLLVSGSLAGEPALACVERSALPAGSIERETVIDETRRSYRLTLDGIELPGDRVLRGAPARVALVAIRDAALLLHAAEACGGTAGVLALTVDYLNTRTAFGRKIGGYQALKHPCVDILVGLERARSHVYHAASLVAAGRDTEIALRMAKAEASDAFTFAGDRAIQFHGGFGFTWECDAQIYLRRALWLEYAFGDAAHQRRHLARLLLDDAG